MTDIEKIKDEIERLCIAYKNESVFSTVRSRTAKEVLEKIMSFIESVEKESNIDLEKEMDDYFDHMELQEREMIYEDTFHKICEHFYKLRKSTR